MLTVTLKKNGKIIGEIGIVGDDKNLGKIGNYEWILSHYTDKEELIVRKDGSLAGFNRDEGAWALVKNILKEAV